MLNAKGITNCPNCGAPITSEKCPYCGTIFYDFSCIDFANPSYIKIKYNGEIIMCKAIARDATLRQNPLYSSYQRLGDAHPTEVRVGVSASVEIEFDVIPVDGILFTTVKEDN